LNKEEATELKKKIIAKSNGLTEGDIMLVIPKAGDPSSHGYQLHIKPNNVKAEMPKIKAIAQENSLEVESREDTVIVFRPCFVHYSNRNFDSI
jgi:hypothetical protein